MEDDKKIPKRLYKYRDFSNRTLDMVISDKVYYADPSTFNDPLDTQPSLKIDLDEAELKKILRSFVERRISAEMSAAANIFMYRGPNTSNYIKRHSRQQVDRLIQEIEFSATNPEYDSEDPERSHLGYAIEDELRRQYEKGIASLAERATCSLMWSHYGDQHRGVCIGYSVPENAGADLHKVMYGGSRLVEASKVAAMLAGDDIARSHVDEVMLFRKAASWRYEREWRLIGPSGLRHSPLELEEIIFGMRCMDSAKYAVMKALKHRDRLVEFYEMQKVWGTFKLKKRPLSYNDQLLSHFPIRVRSNEIFKDLLPDTSSTITE